jgi:TorA maturation chaperone TorD
LDLTTVQRRRAKFVNEHLLQWVPTFTARVRQNRPQSLYGLLALVVLRYLELEAAASI